jgi:hypothetical protein
MRIFPQALERLPLEGVERVRRPVFERVIREKPELRITVVAVDHVAQLERERGRDGNGTGDVRVIGQHLRLLAVSKDTADHVAGVVIPDGVDRRGQLIGLLGQRTLRQVTQVEPDRDGQPGQDQQHEQDGDEKPARDVFADSLAQSLRSSGQRRSLVGRFRGKGRACSHADLAFDVFNVAIVPGPSAEKSLRLSPRADFRA